MNNTKYLVKYSAINIIFEYQQSAVIEILLDSKKLIFDHLNIYKLQPNYWNFVKLKNHGLTRVQITKWSAVNHTDELDIAYINTYVDLIWGV
jgi:hypothetical protein